MVNGVQPLVESKILCPPPRENGTRNQKNGCEVQTAMNTTLLIPSLMRYFMYAGA
ncbi:hypothetical protein KIN20_015220 [Parelaphostrongylus tenuis]|uniref:Uncharacterized protein n=1 Tax=Parelaphostrongylus tenuis TaxID=148309 RepID=A0AAD5MJ74_PARTN|nr:hypothetical protein KIN20_015220 [Parelaphostrongylus tenuis]